MKLKQFIFAFVAMLSFSFSSFAQSIRVSDEDGLRNALESTTGSEVVLENNIEFSAQITIPKKTAHTLDLNGHKITGGIYVYGTLTINDNVGTGSITANTYVLNGAGGSKIILNGGRIYRGSSWSVYTTGIFVVNGGEVANTIRVAGSGSIQLNGGTVTAVQVTSGNLNITDDAVVNGNLNIEKGAKGVNIADGTINGDITIATEAAGKVTVSGGTFKDADAIKDYLPGGSALLQKPDGTYEIVAGLLKIGDTYYPTLAAALAAAQDGATIELINQEGSVIAMNGSLCGKSVTITGTAKVDWSKGFLFVGRGGEGDATLTFDNANLTSASNQATYGIHVSGREKGTADKYDGTLVIKNSTIDLDYLINKGAMTLDNSSLTVKNGFDLNGRPASETENGEDANATLALNNNSKLVVNNHNGMGIGREGKGELTVDATSTFEHTQDFIVRANGTMDVQGTLVSNGKKLTNNGELKFTATKLTAATIEGTGTTLFYNDVNFYGANSITTTEINGTPFHLVVNEGANLFITRFVLGYNRNITVNGRIADASAFNPEGQTPSLKFNSASGVSVGGTGTGNLQVKNAYVELGNSSWKNAQGTYDWDFVNSYVSAVSFTNATGADAATWDVTFNNSILDAKNYIKNGKNVTYNFTNNSRGTTGSLRIDGELNIDATSSVVTTSQQNNKVGAVDEHGGINGTVNVAGNLTIGSNAKTQLEVLGGTVNVKEGATLALGNNTLTLDATSAMQSAGNISGAITAADGANVAITGGTYTQDVNKWCAEGYMTQQNADGSFGIAKAVAKVGDKKYATLEEAFKAATSGCTIDIVSDVTVDYNWDARYTGGKFTVPVTINGNGKTIKFTASVNDNNYQASFRFEADATVKNLTIDMSEVTDNRFRAISSKGNLTVDNSKFIGKNETLNCRAIIFGEGAGTNVGNLAISVTNSEFINWKRGITDNENAQDVKTVTITGNTLTDAGVGVSAKEKVTFTGNTVEGAYVNIKSYTAGNKLAVTATGNTLEANTDETGKFNVIDAGGVVNAEGFNIVAKGGSIIGYTSTEGIYGEVWGNSRESFVIKVVDAQGKVMGTTSLNKVGDIIDGDVYVTWNIKFNAAANTDEYWTMAWTTAPSIDNMPAKVQLWVDDVKVSEGNVVLNGPDNIWPIYAAVTDADGKIISCHTSVESAAATNATNIALLRDTNEEIILPAGVKLNTNGFTAANVKTAVAVIGTQKFASLKDAIDAAKAGDTVTVFEGTYAVPSMKAGITIVGEGNVLFEGTLTGTLENLTMKNIHIKGGNAQRWAYAKGNLVFENVTFEATSVYALHFDGIAEGTNLTYKNCTIIGWAAMGGSPASCVFEGCTIKGNGSYGLIRTYFDTTIKDCTFDVANVNTNDAYEDGIHAVDGANFVVTNCTNKNGEMKDLVNVHATSKVTVDGVVYENVAKAGDNYYATLAEAFAAVGDGAGKTVELIADVDLAGAEWTPVKFNGVFDGKDHTISNLVVNGAGKSDQGFFAQTQNGEIKNVTFHNAKVTGRLNVGVVAGTPYTSKYTNVKVTGHVEVNGMAYVGGVGGKNAYANWTDITVDVDETSYVNATSTENGTAYRTYVGGVIGFNGEGGHTFKNISSNIKVIGDVMDIGGIFGILHYGNNAENITFTGAVEAPAEAKEVGGIAGVWHNQQGQTVTITGAKSEGTVQVGDVSTTGSIVGGAYNADNKYEANSGSLIIDDNEAWLPRKVTTKAELDAAIAAAKEGDIIVMDADIDYGTTQLAIAKAITLDLGGKTLTTRNAWGGMSIKNNPTVKNGTIVHASNTAAIKVWNATAFEDLVIDVQGKGDANKTIGGIVLQEGNTTRVGSIKNVTIMGAALTNGIETYNCGGATENVIGAMENVTIDAQGTGLLISAPCGTAKNCEIKGGVNAVEIFIKGNYSASLELVASTVEGGVYAHDEFSSNPSIVNNGTLKFTADDATTGASAADVTLEIARAEADNVQGVLKEVMDNAVAKLNNTYYATLQAAVNAVKNGETITLLADVAENVTLTEKVDLYYTIDGAGKQFKGSISVNSLSDTEDNRRITIKNIKFVDTADANVDFISSVNTNHYPRLTIEGCTFTGSGNDGDVAVRLKSSHSVVIKDCTGTGLHSFLQNTSGWNLTIKDVTVTNSKSAFALGTVQGVTVQGVKVDVKGYGIRLDANTYNNNAEIVDNAIKAFIPVVVRDVNTTSNVIFAGKNEFTAGNTDGKWCVIGTTEYEENGKLPAEVAAGNVVVTLKDEKLTYDGIHGAGLAGKGTAEAPYLINNVAELEIFRASVNAGSTKYNAPGLWVALNADIDLANAEWIVGIGDGHNYSFDGNFDGKKHTIKNLNIKPYADADNYICAGLFGYTYGAVTIKNLTIENAKVEFTGAEDGKTYHNVGVLVGFANNKDGKLNVDNVTVKGDIKVDAPQTYGVGAIVGYSYRDMGAITNTNVLANKGSYIKGQRFVAGITGYSYNGAVIDNCTVENLAITGEIGVGGIAGLALNDNKIAGCTVKYVTVNGDKNVAYIVGELPDDGGNVTVADNCNAPQPWVGGSWNSGESFVATIGTQYYTSVAKAIEAAKENDVITLIADITASDIITINKPVTLDGKGKTLTSTAGRAINVDCEGNVGIKNLTIDAKGERAINVIQKPAKVTIEGVTATAANYTVNLASSAGAAEVAISNSNLTGLNVVNVAAPGSNVTISGGTITCNDQNANENYAALTLNKDAKNGKITAAGVEFNIEGNSRKATNQAEGGIITIDGSANEVEQHVAYISYGNNWYGFATLEAAIAKANAGETVTLLRDVKASAIITINKAITLDGKGKTLTSTAGRAINVDCAGNVGIKNLTIDAKGERAINIIDKPANVTVDNVTATAKNYAVMMATSATGANLTVNNSDFTGLAVVNVASEGSNVEINNTNITNVDANEGENYGAISIYKTALNATVVVNGGKVVVAADSKAASIGAAGATVTFNGTEGNTEVQTVVAYIGDAGYTSIEEAIKDAKAGDVVTIMPGEYNKALNVNKAGITVQGEVDAEGKNLVKFNAKLNITANGAAVKNIDVKNSGTAAYISAADVLVENCNLEGSNGLYQSYAKGTVTFKNSVITGGTYGVHFDGSTGGNIVIEGCTITGWTSFAGTIANVEISKTTFADGNYDQLRFYQNATLTECVFNENMTVDFGKNEVEAEFTDCTVENGGDLTDVIYLGDIADMGVKVTIDDKPVYVQAKVGGNYYQTLLEAVEAAEDGKTVTVLTDVNVDTKNCVTCGGYSSIFNVKGIELTFDLNGHTITVVADPADFADGKAKGNMLMGVFTVDEGGKLTIDNSSDDKTGAVNVSANGATVYSLAAAYGKDAKLTINNGSYYVDKMPEATSLIYAQHSECVIINGGTYNIGNVGTMANGSPWIFNTKGQNMDGIYVNGGTYPNDINHQFWFNEAIVPGNLAVKANENGTWSVVEAVAYTNEVGRSTGSWRRNVGYATIEEAIAATQMYNCEGNVVTLAKNVEIEQMITVANGVEVTLDLNGKTLAATDNTSKNYSAIDNRGELTIVDSSKDETGKITVAATVNSGWNRYSAVIANNPGGELTVMSGTIEHLGGTDMAYGIDNLTNGKGTHAVTEIYGGVVKSPYRAVRQFLNGVEANNTLAVYGGTLEGANKSIWMQDPSKNANTGNLYVGEEAVLNGDVYLTVTAGSTEWPVEVEVAVAALKGESTVVANNVPANYHVTEYPTAWIVECSKLAELTIDEADYAKTGYINLVEKTVEELTYVREFENNGWQSLYLPFGFTITEEMAAEFEFAYIYNASYKNKETVIDFVKVGVGFELAANYPYMIRAKEAGEKVIVVENAVLEVTKNETIDCSTVFEKFTFAGNYAANFAPEASDKKKYYVMDGGEWNDLDTLNPFRFFLQIEYRNGSSFVDNAQAIRMRSVNANGEETTGINGVDAEQAGDFIFDLHGRRVLETEKGGIYIKGGKKFIAQ